MDTLKNSAVQNNLYIKYIACLITMFIINSASTVFPVDSFVC